MTDVVFGETSDTGFSASFFSAGEAWASKFTLSGGDPSAVLSKITAYMSDRSGSLQDLCVWRDVSGSPDALVGYGTPASPGPAGFYDATTLTLVDMAGVMPDGDYWIGFQDTASGLTQNLSLIHI